jgi:hypothetical protein
VAPRPKNLNLPLNPFPGRFDKEVSQRERRRKKKPADAGCRCQLPSVQMRRFKMLKQLTLAGLASALVLSVAVATPSFAHARSFGRAGGFHAGHFHQHSYFGRRAVRVPGHVHHNHWHWRHGSNGWRYGYTGGYPVYGAVSTPAPVTCTCLTKTYLQDGTVVFADQCTKESAAASPAGTPRG